MKKNASEVYFVTESIHPSISSIIKKKWKTPELIEMDYMSTNDGHPLGDDGGFTGSYS